MNYSALTSECQVENAAPPITFQQQWLWDLIRKYPDWKCVVPYAFCLKGELNIPLLQRSLDEVIRRHDSLRTRIVTADGTPRLAIAEPGAYRIDVVPVVGHSRTEILEGARQLFAELADRTLDPAVGPLLSVRLLKLDEHEHWLLVGIHRLAADCSSAELFFQELWRLYRAPPQNSAPHLPSSPRHYGNYAVWQRAHGYELLRRHEDYWTKQLAGAETLRWPSMASADRTDSGATDMMSCRFGIELSGELHALARRTRSLSAMVMLSIYVVILWRWCGQRDFILPFNVAGRQAEHKSVIGYFSHVLYLRIQMTGQETFSELQGLVSNVFFRALSRLDFGRQGAERPDLLAGLFCQWVTWHTDGAPVGSTSTVPDQLEVERLPLSEFGQGLSMLPPEMVDVDLTFFDTTQGIYVQGVHRTDRLTSRTAARLMSDLRAASEFFVRNPGATVATGFEEHCRQQAASAEAQLSAGSGGI